MPRVFRTPHATHTFADLGFSPRAVRRLQEWNLHTVADLVRISADQLLTVPGIGKLTVHRLRRYLVSIGHDFAAPENPIESARERHRRSLRAVSSGFQPTLSDASPIADLPVSWRAVRCCLMSDIKTVGEARSLSPSQMSAIMSRRCAAELMRVLGEVNLPPTAVLESVRAVSGMP